MKTFALALVLLTSGSAALAEVNDPSVTVIFDYIHSSAGKAAFGTVIDACLALQRDDQQGFGSGDYTLREVHDRACGGDPGIEPALAFFTVTQSNGETFVTKMDIVSGTYEPVFSEVTPK